MDKLLGRIMLVLILAGICHAGLFSWLFKKKKDNMEEQAADTLSSHDSKETTGVALTVKIPFEIKSSDEKFLMEAQAYTSLKLSELDICHHKVILSLQKSCAELTEEDLSKVAVNLLNCQSAAENRAIYPCTKDMSLTDCTRDMDSNTWNAYHIISNRARAVCYASRQEQFGAKTQMAVNVLMHTAEEQIKSMGDLQEGQEALGKATSDTLESLSQGHEHLKQQQQQLSTAHQHVHSFISLNLRELSREKKLIASGQRELALITESIKRKLDEAKQQLLTQGDSQRHTHGVILQDLSTIQENALKVWQKLDASTQKILLAHEETVQQYGRLTDDLQRMNATVHHLMNVLESTKQGVEDQLSWITSLVGDTDYTIQKVYSCVLHACYFLMGMISASFLQVPYLTRVALVVLVPLNALAELKHDTSLQFSTLTTILALCIFINLSVSFIWGIYQYRKKAKSVQNTTLYQPLAVSTNATCFSSMAQLYTKDNIEEAKETQSTTKLSNSASSNIANVTCDDSRTEAACDYSSDEEPSPIAPFTSSQLRRRMFGGVLNGGSAHAFGAHKETDGDEVSDSENNTVNKVGHSETTVKTLSNVRRQLLDHLTSSQPNPSLHNLSLDIRNSASSSPMKDILLDHSASSRSLTPRKLCTSLCKNGQVCRNVVSGGKMYCHRHGGGSRESTPFSARSSRRNTPLRS